ncbi:unnamed protein product [Arctia plantaginis]|uniref:Uncharacterized protein n=1 Tax=Arctia plantaginis TaxID=874455 RepID=A0A8S0ZJU0_ARCPL|nr:unnamed protein product [Arctia plantaginis]
MIVKKTTERRQFMRKLSEELALPMIEHRTANPQVMRHFSTKIAVESILGHALAETIEINPGPVVPKDKTGRKKVTGSCHVCNALPIKRRRKTQGHYYVWDECIGKNGPNEIASFLFDFIKQKASQGIKEFRFYFDCCGGQNRNRIIFLMYAYAPKVFGVNIKHSFFEVGHSQSEGDSMHALIEPRKPYAVKEVNQNDIFDFKSLLNLVPNWELDKDKMKMMWSKVNYIEINMQSPNIINFQNDFYSDQLNWIDLDYHKVKTRRLNKNKNLDTLWSHTLVIAYKSLHPITQSKYKDLMSLCSSGAIPEQYRMFYVNLPHSNTVTNTVDLDIED